MSLTGGKGHLFQGNRGTKATLRGTNTILGNREHTKTNFRVMGNRGTRQFILGNKRTGTSGECLIITCTIRSNK